VKNAVKKSGSTKSCMFTNANAVILGTQTTVTTLEIPTIEPAKPERKWKYRKGAGAQAKALGYKFEHEIDQSLWYLKLQGYTFWHYKLPDTHAWDSVFKYLSKSVWEEISRYMEKGKVDTIMDSLNVSRYISPKVPSDFIIVKDGRTLFLETKSSSAESIDIDYSQLIKEHQDSFAIDVCMEGGAQYVYGIYTKNYDKLMLFDTEQRMKAGWWQRNIGFGSIKWNELKPFANIVIERDSGRGSFPRWDLTKLIEAV